jgi:UDP-glucose 4-epimerase
MRILITGGAGFIGSYLCEKYTKEGQTVLCLDNFLSGNLLNVRHLLGYRNFKLIEGDIRNFDLLERISRDLDVIFHLAAQIHVDRSYVEPRLTFEINVMGTQNVLEMARIFDVKKVIHTSTSEVYGSAQYVPIDEKHPLDAPHPYGASKIAADRMCHAYITTYGMNISIPRFFNIFGPRQRDIGYGGVISIFTRRVLNNMPPVIYGDGRQTRDYTYVEDAVRAFDLILNHESRLDPINIGTGKEVSIIDLANMIVELCGRKGKIRPVNVEPRIGEVKKLIADTAQAKKILKWEPKYKLRDGLKAFIQWYKQFGQEERIRL